MSELRALGVSFGRHLRAEGKSPRTIDIYLTGVRLFCDWLDAHELGSDLADLTRDNLRGWLADLSGSRAPATVETRHKALFRFCRWLIAEDELDANPMVGIASPTVKPPPVPVLTDDELRALLKASSGRDFMPTRDTAMLRLLLDCGLRVSELCALTVADTDLDNGYALVKGKGGKVRPAYMSSRTVAAVDRYLRRRAAHPSAHEPELLIGRAGPLSTEGVRRALLRLGERAGVPNLHPHRFRHTWAHDFMLNGGQERDLKRLAGWSSDVMLERYGASAADARAREAARRMRRGDRV